MRSILVCLMLTCLCACATGGDLPGFSFDASSDVVADAAPALELVCANEFCGNIVDKNTGATANCGSCSPGEICGDNGQANVCGVSCIALTASDGDGGAYLITPACDYFFGNDWYSNYASAGVQIPSGCDYTDPNNCALITNPWPANGVCSGTVCGTFWCCLDQADAGWNPLLPGAIADNDGGLP